MRVEVCMSTGRMVSERMVDVYQKLTRDVEVEVDEKSGGVQEENTDRQLNYEPCLPYDQPRLLVPVEVTCWMSATKSENEMSKGTHHRQKERTS